MKFLSILIFLMSSTAFAGSIDLDVGLGVYQSGITSLAESKVLKLTYDEQIWQYFGHRFNAGFWLDNAGNGRLDSGFVSYQLGFDIKNQLLEAGIYSGPAAISTPDAYLGGNFQFNETIFIGIPGKHGEMFGFVYNHFSSAGIEMPNIGRDFMGIELKFPLDE